MNIHFDAAFDAACEFIENGKYDVILFKDKATGEKVFVPLEFHIYNKQYSVCCKRKCEKKTEHKCVFGDNSEVCSIQPERIRDLPVGTTLHEWGAGKIYDIMLERGEGNG